MISPSNQISERVSLVQIAKVFGRIGLTSFGGGMSSWIFLDAVEKRQWIQEDEFLAGLALSQILPGPNVVNLAIFIGNRLRGVAGSATATLSLLVPPMVLVLILAALVHRFGIAAGLHSFLEGVAAGAVGLTVCVGTRGLRAASRRQRWPFIIAGLTLVCIGLWHVPLLYVVLALLPVAFALSWNMKNRV